jgi:hypothetical protein
MDFNSVDEMEMLDKFLDPSAGSNSPLFNVLLASNNGELDMQNQLLGAVRLRLIRSPTLQDGTSSCPRSWLKQSRNVSVPACAARNSWLVSGLNVDKESFRGSVSGQLYQFCNDGIFCHTESNQTDHIDFAQLTPAFCYWPADRWGLDVHGHVLDLPPRDPTRAQAMVRSLLDDSLLDDGVTRALFMDYTIFSPPLSFAVVVHLTVEMLPTGRMVSRTESVALPFNWPFEDASSIVIVVAEAVVVLWTLAKVSGEALEAGRQRSLAYLDIWNIIDLVGLVVLMLWIVCRVWWWICFSAWAGMDIELTDQYVGWMQPLSRLMFVQRAFASFGLILSWMQLQKELQLMPNFGPLLQAFLSTLLSPVVLAFVAVMFFFTVRCARDTSHPATLDAAPAAALSPPPRHMHCCSLITSQPATAYMG